MALQVRNGQLVELLKPDFLGRADPLPIANLPVHDMLTYHSYVGGAALDVFGLSAPNTLARLTPSSNPGAAAAIVATDASGYVQLTGLGIGIAAGMAELNVYAADTPRVRVGSAANAYPGYEWYEVGAQKWALVNNADDDLDWYNSAGSERARCTQAGRFWVNSDTDGYPGFVIGETLSQKWAFVNDTTDNLGIYDLDGHMNVQISPDGNVWMIANCSALSFTDRTPYPDAETALSAVLSMRQDGQGLDHKHLHPYLRAATGGRNLSAAVSAQNVIIQQLLERIHALEDKCA